MNDDPPVLTPGDLVRFKRRVFDHWSADMSRRSGELVSYTTRIDRMSPGGLLAEFGHGKEAFAVPVKELERVDERTPNAMQEPAVKHRPEVSDAGAEGQA